MAAARLLALAGLPALLAAQDAAALLARVDRLRNPIPAFSVQLDLRSGREAQRWSVSVRENGDARVEGLSGKEKGRAVLMLGDEMWLLLPTAKRPIKVSPQQRMMGPASGGDLARTRFSADYTATDLAADALDGVPCWRIELVARRPSISYRTARLWMAKDGERPLQAEFRLPSGKLGKTMQFGALGSALGHPVLTSLSLSEPGGASTELRFGPWAPLGNDPHRFALPEAR